MSKYKQLTSEERYIISHLRMQGFNQSEIARQLGRHRSTISREIARNRCWITDGAYRPSKAQRRTRARRRRSRRNEQYTDKDYEFVRLLLSHEWSPEQITGYLRQQGMPAMSHETIYRYIWKDKQQGGDLWLHLRQSSKKRRKRYKAYDSRGRLADKKHISERPMSVEGRRYFGHWEIDTVMGKYSKDCIVTLVERKTGFVMIGKLADKTTASLNADVISLIGKDHQRFKTITADNGTEFHQYKEIEEKTNTKFYFATPHHSWERGSNENMNGLIRQYLPKGKSMKGLTQEMCDYIAERINKRPRKRYEYKTPWELYHSV